MPFIVPMKALQQKHTYKFERMVDYYDELQLFRSNDRGRKRVFKE